MSVGAIVLAGGKGVRFGGEKQYQMLDGKYYYEHVRSKVAGLVDEVVTVGIDTKGGASRAHSVYIGLENLNTDNVIILEAARPLVTEDVMNFFIHSEEVSLVAATNSTYTTFDTAYKRHGRRNWSVDLHLPQRFSTDLLRDSYKSVDEVAWKTFTSDSELVQFATRVPPQLSFIPETDAWQLYKVTYPYDHIVVEALYNEYCN